MKCADVTKWKENCVCFSFIKDWFKRQITGYLEREIKKDMIPMLDTGENPDAPQPREMIDLEVTNFNL